MAVNRVPMGEYARKQLGITAPQRQRKRDEQAGIVTKCAGCVHRTDLGFDCSVFEQRGFDRDGRMVVTWCDGFEAVAQ